MRKTYNIGIYALSSKLVATYEVEAWSVEEAREIAWDLFIQESYADEIEEEN